MMNQMKTGRKRKIFLTVIILFLAFLIIRDIYLYVTYEDFCDFDEAEEHY